MHDSICDVFVVRVRSIAMRCLCLCLCMRVRAREWKNTKSTLAHTYSHKQRKIEMIHRTFEHFLLFVVKLANDDNKGSTSADFIFAISIDNLLQVNLKISSRPYAFSQIVIIEFRKRKFKNYCIIKFDKEMVNTAIA